MKTPLDEADKRLARYDREHGGFGVEGIFHPHNACRLLALYVNVGDPYRKTLLYDFDQDVFLETPWGDWLEEWEMVNLKGEYTNDQPSNHA